jgi:serine/threonine protein kinase
MKLGKLSKTKGAIVLVSLTFTACGGGGGGGGGGGMGSVYKAFDEKLKRTVAVKVLSGFRAQRAREKERFLQEAQAAAQLNHPNICEVYEIGESQDGSLFIVTAFCEGSNLAQLIGDNSLNLETILSYLLQLCHALETAHQQKIIHRDIKPANIIVDPSGQIRLVDFGVAKIQGHDISVSNQLVGTFAYMSPEQFSGVSVDQRSDIWSIGILLFECLTNHRPFPSDQPAEIMYNIFNAPQPQIKDTELPLLDSFNTILKRCLNVDKQLRFSSTHLLANELRSLKQQLQTHDQLQWQPKPSNLKNC